MIFRLWLACFIAFLVTGRRCFRIVGNATLWQ